MSEISDLPDTPLTYADAGVSIAAGNALVRMIAPLARATARRGADAELGGFGGFFDLPENCAGVIAVYVHASPGSQCGAVAT